MLIRITSRLCGALMFCLAFPVLSAGQQGPGLPPFGSFGGGPADTVNNANLNVHFEFPVFSRAGRGLPFSYSLSYDSEVWTPVVSGSSTMWMPVSNWGWGFITQPQIGYVSYATYQLTCNGPPPSYQRVTWSIWDNFAYVDGLGTSHPFQNAVSNWQSGSACGGGPPASATGIATDSSGYTLSVSVSGSSLSRTLTARSGTTINAPLNGPGAGGIVDTNGNQFTASSSSYFDTLSSSTPVLTVSGTGSSAYTFAYTNPAGNPSSYTLNYASYSVRTNFGCGGISEYTSSSQPLVSSLSLPDGTEYSFTYEPTPGFSGSVTGRLLSVTLPTGGTITYGYAGGNEGITCADGTTAILYRTTSDGTWAYSHSGTSPAYSTMITDPAGNQTSLQFQSIYETQRKVYQGSSTTTPLEQVDTCYNGAAAPCTGTFVSLPITQVSVTNTLPGSPALVSGTVTSYNSYGLPTEVDEYDFGSGAVGSPLRKTLTSYASLSNNIMDHPAAVQIQNGGGTLLTQTSYTYDEYSLSGTSGTPQHLSVSGSRGNPTTVVTGRAGAVLLTRQYSYFDTGNVNQATDTNGAVTTYTYGNCGNSFVSNVSFPLSLWVSQGWNCTGAVQTSANDLNGQNWSTSYSDANYWRPTGSTDPTGASTTVAYGTGPSFAESALNFNGASSTADVRTTLDGLGRTQLTQQRQSQTGEYDTQSGGSFNMMARGA